MLAVSTHIRVYRGMLSSSTLFDYIFHMASNYHHPHLRAALLQEGRRLLLQDGYSQFSLRKLATALGVSHNAPYRHFESREELIKAILEEDAARFAEALALGVEGVTDPRERLMCLGEAYVSFFLDNPEILLLFETLPGQLARQGQTLLACFEPVGTEESMGEGYALLKDAATRFMPEHGGLSEREVILGYWAKVHGLAALLVGQKGFLPAGNLKERVRLIVRTPF